MSLDVFLKGPPAKVPFTCSCCGQQAEEEEEEEFYSANITHNLGKMAREAGIYQVLWRPEETPLTTAAQLIPFLKGGLSTLQGDSERFRHYNPSNGWGSYDGLVRFVQNYLQACQKHPDAFVSVSR